MTTMSRMPHSLLWAGALVAALSLPPPGPLTARAHASVSEPCPTSADAVDPFSLYGERLMFTVNRNGTPVGVHEITFDPTGDGFRASTLFTVTIEILSVPVYRYVYRSTEDWQSGCLQALRAETNDDGDLVTVTASADNGSLRIEGPRGSDSAPLGTLATTHWNAAVLDVDAVINTLTGRVNRVRIEDRGEAVVVANGRSIPARHYVYTGDLSTEVWYDDRGRWVKMRFEASDGSTIDVLCRSCGLEMAATQ